MKIGTFNRGHPKVPQCTVRVQSRLSPHFPTRTGLRQGDGLSCLLFNLALEKVVRESGIQTRGTIYYKSVQLLGYADDLDLMSRTLRDLQSAFSALKLSAEKMGLRINEGKTKYMFNGTSQPLQPTITLDGMTFEQVECFTYLGSKIEANGTTFTEIMARISASNRCYFGMLRHFKSKLLSRGTKCRLYKTLIRPVLTYGSETWTITKQGENKLRSHERSILRRIFGPVYENGTWRRRRNDELYDCYKEDDVVKFIKLCRLRWAGHVMRLDETDPARKACCSEPGGRRARGRPRLRWSDEVGEDAARVGCRNWRSTAKSREEWQKIIEEAKSHPGM